MEKEVVRICSAKVMDSLDIQWCPVETEWWHTHHVSCQFIEDLTIG